ncbi:membralin [Nephila pilipes]|uniref:Membralin n=1 Tax=Nephila pilipes TaxID=299642 RepID=A0A8X6TG91_NEPPI|nr:membralin [Nephila pilipes]
MAERKDQKGFVRNAVMEIEYLFINNWTNDKSLFTAAFIMIVFTLTISTLLRHSHHQIFIVVGEFDATA